jgi:hypothetical protein
MPSPLSRLLVVWVSDERSKRTRARPLTALTDPSTGLPLAFTMDVLDRSSFFSSRPTATEESLSDLLLTATATAPVLVPTHVATACLGWTDFAPYLPASAE